MAKNIVMDEKLNKLGLDAYLKRPSDAKFSAEDLDGMIKTAVETACGGAWSFAGFMKNKYDVFAVIASVMPASMRASLAGKFERFAEFRDDQMGESTSFNVKDNDLFKVYTIARGTQSVSRQTILNKQFSVTTLMRAISIYAELDEMMAGRVNFTEMVDRVSVSFAHEIGLLISDVIYGAYSSVGTTWKATAAYDEDTLDGIIENVKAASGKDVIEIYGSQSALGNITTSVQWSDKMKDEYHEFGYVGAYKGNAMIAFPQAYEQGGTTLAVNTSYILILPAGEKIVKVVLEGMPVISMDEPTVSNDLQPEFFFGRRIGVAAITVQDGQFGMYKFS